MSISRFPLNLFLTLLAGSAMGDLVSYRATGVFSSSDFPLDIGIGDQFTINFTLDDSVHDLYPQASTGDFPTALTSFEFRLTPGASSGQFAGGFAGYVNLVTAADYADYEMFYLGVTEGTFPSLGGYAFGSLLFALTDSSHTSLKDPGGDLTLGDVLHGPLELSQFDGSEFRIGPTGKNGSADGQITSLQITPEPASGALWAAGFFLVGWQRQRRNWSR